jgi:hypothetical protein
MNGVGQETRQRETPAERCAAVIECERPPGNGACDRAGGNAPAKRDRVELLFPIERRRGARAGGAAGVDGARRFAWRMNQPERVAADRVHVRIHDGDACGRGHHRLERVAAVAQNRYRRLRRK